MSAFQERFAQNDDAIARRYDYDEVTVLVADFGADRDGSVDLVGETAIVVVGDEEYEFEVPEGVARASMTNGVVTIEVKR
ncbi:DUF7127 family protein [Halorarius halobius]|uniref:DUF7127 family protein n=1 Tax=Halorarius halobius TaxID=2962671 RepID=UPI0020CECACB|nr:hypothetical protein [Halorarius halobius]